MSLGQNIAEIRKWRGLTQRQLAELLNVSQSYLARWEKDHSQPRPGALEQIASALDVSVAQLMAGGQSQLENALDVDDQELIELLRELKHLTSSEMDALKTVIRGLLSRSRLERMLQH